MGGLGGERMAELRRRLGNMQGGRALYAVLRIVDRVSYCLWFLARFLGWVFLKSRPSAVMMASFPYSSYTPGITFARLFSAPLIVDTCDGWAVDDADQFSLLDLPDEEVAKQQKLMRTGLAEAYQVWCSSEELAEATASEFSNIPADRIFDVQHGFSSEPYPGKSLRAVKQQVQYNALDDISVSKRIQYTRTAENNI